MLPTLALKKAKTLLASFLRKGIKYLPTNVGPIVLTKKLFEVYQC